MPEILENLRNGEAIILPSDTVYGIHADALNVKAIKKVDQIKKSNKPHIMLVSSVNMMQTYVKELSSLQREIVDAYWPGELTILFKKNDLVPSELTKGSEYVGIRMPNNGFLLDIINKFNKPILSTSANISNEEVITSVDMLDDSIKKNVSYIYDGGKLSNVASTIIKIENNKIIFLREGNLASKIKNDFKDYL